MYTPTLDQFHGLARKGRCIPVSRQILADMETPVSAFRKIDSGNYAFLLESVEGGEQWGRYSFLGSNPSLVLRVKDGRTDLLRAYVRQANALGRPQLIERLFPHIATQEELYADLKEMVRDLRRNPWKFLWKE